MNEATIVTMDKLMMNVTVISSMISYYLHPLLAECNGFSPHSLALQRFSIHSVVISLLYQYILLVSQR